MEKVVKCINSYCGQHFMHTEKALKCPFCKTEYVEIDPVRSREGSQRAPVEEKTQKKSFKIWGKKDS